MVSNLEHWFELSKMDAMDDAVSSDFIMLDPKIELEELIKLDITVNDAEAGRIAEGGGVTGCTVPGMESTIPVSLDFNMSRMNMACTNYPIGFYDSLKQPDQKPQIRHDCMWAGTCADLSHPEKSSAGCGGCTRHNLLQQQQQQQQPPQSSVADTYENMTLLASKNFLKATNFVEPPAGAAGEIVKSMVGSVEGSCTLPTSQTLPVAQKSAINSMRTPFKAAQSSAQIPAGSSLLIKRPLSSAMLSQSCKQLPPSPPSSSDSCISSSESGSEAGDPNLQVIHVPHLSRGSFLAGREQEARSIAVQNHARPDTPLSLDDDPPEFKHNLDLVATCTIGSNQQSLLHTASSSSLATSSSSGVPTSSVNDNTTTAGAHHIGTSFSSATTSDAESRTGALYGRLGESCNCNGESSTNISNTGGVGCHTTQCYYNYLQDTSSVEDIRNKQHQLREQVRLLDDPQSLGSSSNHHHYHHHHAPNHQQRSDSPDRQLEQLLIDLREIERSSETRCYLMDDHHHALTEASSVLAKDNLQLLLHSQQHQHQHQQQQHGERNQSSLAPCGGGLSGGAHAACNKKECCWSSLELSHHLESPNNERKRRHQFAHRRRSITARGWISDDDEDEEDDLLKQLEEGEDDYEKHLEQIAPDINHAYPNQAWDDDEEEDDEEDEDEEESEEDDDEKDDQEVDEDDEVEEDAQHGSMYDDSRPSRSKSRSSRNRYHNQYGNPQHRRIARASYRPYDGEVHGNDKSQKQPATNLLANGSISTIIAGSGASLKSSILGSKNYTNCATNGSLSNAVVTSIAGIAQQPASANNNSYQATHFGDHSYTRPKGGYNMNELGVQTPSDSDEEIDVVSVGDKNLPTNPTERDYRHLQSEVASKIRTASSRSTTNGSLQYGSSSHHNHYQRQHQLADGPRQGLNQLGGIYPTPAGSTTISGANTPLPTRSGGASAASSPPPACTTNSSGSSSSRKRPLGGGSSKRSSNSSKRMRLAHAKRGDAGRYDSCAQALAEELDTVEKRNLHNNLERQRRIGLKNLFEELKRQIPQLRDKDRAPKVNILREAAALCTRLNQEAEQLNELRQQQIKLYERVRFLRA
ncbi:uncharacterized protein LOC128306412 [Anopheles moucheti]|uniref:uncharacterized protein LOC128306412 n=1 Tax=Anopheles moucheti TaxID=186751 RepID=UPI0022F03898|nr:uncharacterized protein LOC128306412 [Anopheles moucheti]XP_052899888.1 uncharacterized protein LOC128306412 [Anopheles moucheti]